MAEFTVVALINTFLVVSRTRRVNSNHNKGNKKMKRNLKKVLLLFAY